MLLNSFAVFLGGGIGALFRFVFSELLPMSRWGIPFTIIFVNFLGCFIMGFIDSLYENKMPSAQIRHFAMIGLLGGFTTFSSFSLEFSTLLKNGYVMHSLLYIVVSVLLAVLGFWAGYFLAKICFK